MNATTKSIKRGYMEERKIDTTLLDLDHTPTAEEMKAYFREYDYTTASPLYDASKGDENHNKLFISAKKHFYKVFCDRLGAMGGKDSLRNFSKDYPVKCLEIADENLVAGAVVKIFDDPELTEQYFNVFFSALEVPLETAFTAYAASVGKTVDDLTEADAVFVIDKVADEFLATMMNLMMQSQSVPEILGIKEHTHEDFNGSVGINYDKMDFDKQWNHTRTAIGAMLSFDELDPNDPSLARSDKDSENIETVLAAFVETLDDGTDREIVRLRMKGYNQSDIAAKLGYKSQSAVAKRMKKIREKFNEQFFS